MSTLEQQNQKPRRGRYQWMDVLRGMAIVLVVMWHVTTQGNLSQDSVPVVKYLNEFFAPVRMPTLMLLSGMLLSKSLKKPTLRYLDGKIAGILWPLFIWLSFWMLLSSVENGLPTIFDLINPKTWLKGHYLWYLAQLFALYLTALAFKRLPTWLPFVGFLVATNLLIHHNWDYYISTSKTYLFFGIFISLGYLLGEHMDKVLEVTKSRWSMLMVIPTILVGAASASGTYSLNKSSLLWQIGIIVAVLGLIAFTRHFCHTVLAAPLRWIGKNSIVFYVAHFPAEYLAVLGMAALGGYQAVGEAPYYLGVFAAGLAVPAVLTAFRSNPWVDALFVAPKRFHISNLFVR
ncbi:acyltransferase family protein [Dermabacteraceae bacterium P13077]